MIRRLRTRPFRRYIYGTVTVAVLGLGALWRWSGWGDAAPEVSASKILLDVRPEGWFARNTSGWPTVQVLSVVDGDTLWVEWRGQPKRLRYFGVDTPERHEPGYIEATRRNAALAAAQVRLAWDERREDTHGRLLAYVFARDGRFIDAQLVKEGLGRAWRRDGVFRDRLIQLEETIRNSPTKKAARTSVKK